eukprot:scaffold43086_cov53-Cyclotella_meneghiniana.AAC.11
MLSMGWSKVACRGAGCGKLVDNDRNGMGMSGWLRHKLFVQRLKLKSKGRVQFASFHAYGVKSSLFSGIDKQQGEASTPSPAQRSTVKASYHNSPQWDNRNQLHCA